MTKKITGIVFLFILMILVTSCVENKNNAGSLPEIVIQRLYATSIKIPYDKYGPENVFNATNAGWEAAEGDNVGSEGIMLVLDKATDEDIILNIKAAYRQGFYLFFNGQERYVYGDHNKVPPLGSIFINKIDVPQGTKTIFICGARSSEGKIVGIKEISFYKDKAKLNVIWPELRKGDVSTGFVLEPETAYAPGFLFDGQTDYGWAVGSSETNNAEITFRFEKPTKIKKIRIWNGYQRSDSHYKANMRVKSFSFGPGEQREDITLSDMTGPQIIELSEPVEARYFILKTRSFYPGSAYQDFVISEIQFSEDGKHWFGILDKNLEQIQKDFLNEAKDSPLAKIIDQTQYTQEGGYDEENQTFILRSNGTFLYKLSASYTASDEDEYNVRGTKDIEETVIAEGNWHIFYSQPDQAVVQIFGKKYKTTTVFIPYIGEDPVQGFEEKKIFSTKVVINKDTIKSDLFASGIYINK